MENEELREDLKKKVNTFPAHVQATPAPKDEDEPKDEDVEDGTR